MTKGGLHRIASATLIFVADALDPIIHCTAIYIGIIFYPIYNSKLMIQRKDHH